MINIIIKADTSIKGVSASKGEIKKVDEVDARILVGYGLAEIYEEKSDSNSLYKKARELEEERLEKERLEKKFKKDRMVKPKDLKKR